MVTVWDQCRRSPHKEEAIGKHPEIYKILERSFVCSCFLYFRSGYNSDMESSQGGGRGRGGSMRGRGRGGGRGNRNDSRFSQGNYGRYSLKSIQFRSWKLII